MSNWINVNDRLPDKDGKYLVCYHSFKDRYKAEVVSFANDLSVANDGIFTSEPGFYTNHIGHRNVELINVEYWMPIPEFPSK